jgi:hypothetical protein
VGCNYNAGVAGSALASTPVAIGNGAWDVKTVLGEAMVHPDGSSYFTVPARTPVYFQALDERGYAIQTMRSWSTLQPGERATCVGCHEAKSAAPLAAALRTTALRGPPQDLELFHGPARGFSFPREIQPILDRHCVLCHPGPESALSLRSTPVIDSGSKRAWSEAYLALVGARTHTIVGQPSLAAEPSDMANWVPAQSAPEMLAPYAHGAARSRLMELLQREHRGATLTRAELERFACWLDLAVPYCGDYTEANAWTPEERERYQRFLDKRRRMEQEERDNIRALIVQRHQPHSGGPDETPAY